MHPFRDTHQITNAEGDAPETMGDDALRSAYDQVCAEMSKRDLFTSSNVILGNALDRINAAIDPEVDDAPSEIELETARWVLKNAYLVVETDRLLNRETK